MFLPAPAMIKISSKGQIAIPKEFRAAAGLEIGSQLIIEIHEDGILSLHPTQYNIKEIFGSAKTRKKKLSTSEQEALIAKMIEEEDKKTRED